MNPIRKLGIRLRALPLSSRLYFVLLSLAALGFTAFLAAGPRPWENGVGPRAASGLSVGTREYVVSGEYWAAAANLGLCLLLLAGGPWLLATREPEAPGSPQAGSSPGSPTRSTVYACLIAACALAAWLNAPLLSQSLWGDEEFTTRKHIVGEVIRNASTDALEFRSVPWSTTLWNYKNPNNHIFFSVLARLSHGAKPVIRAPDMPYFSETRLRFPAYLAGLGAVVASGIFLASLGYTRAAVLAPFLLAVHPWFIRYAVQARGYSLVLFLQLTCLILLLRCLRDGKWKSWLLLALSEFLLFYSNPGTLYFLLALNAAALAVIFARRATWLLKRFLVANTLAAMCVIQLMAPCLLPMKLWLARPRAQGNLGWPWIQDALCYLSTGMPWRPWQSDNPLLRSILGLTHSHGLFLAFLGLAALLLLGLGICQLARRGPDRWFLLPLLLPAPLLFLHTSISGNLLYYWYFIGTVPAVVMLWALGADWIAARVRDDGARLPVFLITAGTVFAVFLFITRQQRQIERSHPVEPLYESVRLTREIVNPLHERIDEVITVGFHMFPTGYDPAIRRARNFSEFRDLLREADKTGKPLHVNVAQLGLAKLVFPDIMNLLSDPEVFTLVDTLPGLHEPCTRYVYRYNPESLAFNLPER